MGGLACRAAAALMVLHLAGCGGPLLEVTVVDERTALENQVLGSYAELQREVMVLTSVRGIDPNGARVRPLVPGSAEYQVVLRAMRRQAFNRDDLDHFLKIGVIGENNTGGVTLLASEKLVPEARMLATRLVEEENHDRAFVWQRLIDSDERLSAADLPRLRTILATLNREQAQDGVQIQLPDGRWLVKGAESGP
ncbi:MAG: DUF1318 domain-containing protein [Magnetococcus sp. YQC-9]